MVAGAGYGKSTSVAQATESRPGACIWIECSSVAADPGRLLRRLIDELTQALPGAAEPLAEALDAATAPVDVPAAANCLARDLERLLVDPLTIVFDDAEALEAAPGALAILHGFISRRPPLRVAVASRRPLPLRMTKLRTATRLTEVDRHDLAFSLEECAAMLRLRRREEPSREAVESVLEATQGWPLGVALAATAGNGTELPSVPSQDTLFAFFAEELLDDLDPTLRAAIIDSSVVPEILPEMLPTFGLDEDFAREADRIGLLLAHGESTGSLRYHPLFRGFLADRLRLERSAEETRALHARAASALHEAGRGSQAIDLWLAAEQWSEAITAIARSGRELTRTAPQAVQGWVRALPRAARRDPGVALLEGSLATSAGRHDEGIAALELAVEGYRGRRDVANEWFARFSLADAHYFTGGFHEIVRLAEGFDAARVEEAGVLPALTAFYAATALAQIGRPEESRELAVRAAAQAGPGAPLMPMDVLHAAFLDVPAGRIDRVHSAMEQAIAALEGSGAPVHRLSYLLAGFAQLLAEEGLDDAALEWWERAAEHGSWEGLAGWMETLKHTFATVLHARAGRRAEAQLALSLLGDPKLAGWQRPWIEAARASVAGLQGDGDAALRHAERGLELNQGAPILYQVWMAITLAEVLVGVGHQSFARGAVEEAIALVDSRLPGGHGRFWRARLRVLRAWFLHADGDEGALEQLRQSFEEAGDCLPHILRRDWRWLERLLWSALEDGVLEPAPVLQAMAQARPAGRELVDLTRHPSPGVRIAAIAPAVGSGNPAAIARLEELAEDPDPKVAAAARTAAERVAIARPPLLFSMLGGFATRRGSWPVEREAWGRPMAARLMRFMLINRDRAVPEDLLLEALWPGKPRDSARRSLQVAVSNVRAVLDLRTDATSALGHSGESYRLSLRREDIVDVDEFESAAAAALAERGPARRRLLDHADQLWGGEPLPEDRYDEWTLAWRERLVDRYVELLSALAETCRQAGDHHATIGAARKCVEIDPLNETAHRELMAAYARAGRTGFALRQYLACRRALVDGLGVEPSELTARIHGRILAGEMV